MGKRPVTFKESDLTRAINGARKAKLEIARVEISRDGKITIFAGKPGEACEAIETNKGEWDSIQ